MITYRHKKIFHFIFSILQQEKHALGKVSAVMVVTLVTSWLTAGLPLVFGVTITTLLGAQQASGAWVILLLGCYGLLWTMTQILWQVRYLAMMYLMEGGLRNLTLMLFDHLHALSLRFHLDRKTGEVLHVIDRAQNGLESIFFGTVFFLIPVMIDLVIVVCLLGYYYGVVYAVMAIGIISSFMLINSKAMQKVLRAQKNYNDKRAATSAAVLDSLLNVETVRYFSNQQRDHDHLATLLAEQQKAGNARQTIDFYVSSTQHFVIGICFTVVTVLTGWLVNQGTLGIAEFIAINGYFLQFIMPLQNSAYAINQIRKGIQHIDDAYNLLSLQPENVDHPEATALTSSTAQIVFDHVSFGYDKDRLILQDVSFTVERGTTVAIVGPSGSGKSTIARLLYRFFDVTDGSIRVNGSDIRMVTLTSLHKMLGIVPQQVVLFNTTLYDNIAYGNPTAARQEVEYAAAQARLDSLVMQLPDKYETLVGERGLKLSGGENQRVAIARLLIKKPTMYIFDEATSALDSRTEHDIHNTIREISSGSTTLIIAHRLSTIRHADAIIVLDGGKIVEQGSHTELLMRKGLYYKLWEQQAQNS